jgi:hypothetical protein
MCHQIVGASVNANDGSPGPWTVNANNPSGMTLQYQAIQPDNLTYVESNWIQGNCNNTSSNAMTVYCNGANPITIPEDLAGYTQKQGGMPYSTGGASTSCTFDKDEGWTPFAGSTCNRQLFLVVDWYGLSPQCQ